MKRFISILGQLGLTSYLLAQSTVSPQDEASKVKAAAVFARSLSRGDTELFTRTFQRALQLAFEDSSTAAPSNSWAKSRQEGRADRNTPTTRITADPRYQRNLAAMITDAKGKIWGGRIVAPGAFPDVVAVTGQGLLCTGTVIEPTLVLTAAHCFCGGARNEVLIGDDKGNPTDRIPVATGATLRQCEDNISDGDIAVLRLARATSVAPRKLATAAMIEGAASVLAVGFGRTEDPAVAKTGLKRMVDIGIASPSCSGSVGTRSDENYYGCHKETELVAGAPALDRDTCNGDSGGPVLVAGPGHEYFLAAVTSRAIDRPGLRPCGDGGIYVRVGGTAGAWIGRESAPAGASLRGRQGIVFAAGEGEATGSLVPALLHSPTFDLGPGSALPDPPPQDQSSSLSGTVQTTPGGGQVFVPSSPGVPVLNVEPASRVAPSLIGLPLRATLTNPDPRTARVSGVGLEAVAAWNTSRGSDDSLKAVTAALADLNRTAQTPASSAEAIRNSLETAQAQIVKAASALPPNATAQRQDLVLKQRELRRLKAYYTDTGLYPPATYEQVFQNSRGVVALVRPNEVDPFCSGVLIAADLVLTARHCTEDFVATEITVRFNYEHDLKDQPLADDDYKVLAYAVRGEAVFVSTGPALDFALLRLSPNKQTKLPAWPIQCLSTRRVLTDDPLYVIGHPEGRPHMVADNAKVYFPFEATQAQFDRLRMSVEADLEGRPDKDALLAAFVGSYTKRQLEGGGVVYDNYSQRWDSQPTIGANCNTFHGNSGSPVFDRRTHWVIGILFAGEPDISEQYTAGWATHEAILPMTEIVAQLDRLNPTWRQASGLCIH